MTNNLCRNEETLFPPYIIEVHNCFILMLNLKFQWIIWFEEVRKHLSLKLSTKRINHIWRLHTAKLYQWNDSKKFMIIDKCWRLRLTIMYNEPVGKNLFGQASSVVFCSCWIIEYSCKQSPHWCDEIHPPNFIINRSQFLPASIVSGHLMTIKSTTLPSSWTTPLLIHLPCPSCPDFFALLSVVVFFAAFAP